MNQHLILTASGQDRPGVLEKFTGVLLAHEGNVEASRMAHLGSAFALLMLVSAPPEHIDALSEALSALEGAEFTVHARRAEGWVMPRERTAVPCGISVTGADHLGIVHDVARFLAGQGINVETMNTEVMAAPMSGSPLFTMSAVVSVPVALDLEELRSGLERVGDELGVATAVLDYG